MKDSMEGTKEYEIKRISNLTVEDNEFVNCCEWYDDYLISIGRFAGEDRPKALLHKNIILRNNKFSGNNPKLFNLECCENVVIEGNEYINSKTEVSELGVSPIKLSYCKNIQLDNNLLKF